MTDEPTLGIARSFICLLSHVITIQREKYSYGSIFYINMNIILEQLK